MTESIDLIAAYPQVMMGGEIKHYMIIPECLRRVMPPDEKALSDKLRHPVCQCKGAVYGFAWSGRDFIMSFAGWLIMNRCLTVPEAPALHVLWHDGDDAGAIKRAIKARKYVVAEERAGRNVLVWAAETFSAEPRRAEWWRTAESVKDALTHAKSISGKSSRCAIMTTYVDDCDLDAASLARLEGCANTICCKKTRYKCRNFLVSCVKPGMDLLRVVVCVSLRVITQRRSWRTL